MATTAEQLASVQSLITRLESGDVAEVREGSRSYKLIDLATLYQRETILQSRLAFESMGSAAFAPVEPAEYP